MSNIQPKLSTNLKGMPMHFSVGAVIIRGGKYLLIDRMNPPYGFSGVAGHVDEGEEAITALRREVKEESGLSVISENLIFEEEINNNECKRGINVHYWYLYKVEVEGELIWNQEETKSIGWYTTNEIKNLKLEPVWEYWFKKLGVL